MYARAGFVLFALASALPAMAQVVTLNASTVGATLQGDVLDARYRVSNTNWDHMISTSSNVSGTTIVQQNNIGAHDALNNVTFNFNLSYNPSTGWSYALTRPVGSSSTVVWSSTFNGITPFRSFNALELFVVSGNFSSNIVSGTAAATGMTFTSASATTTGSLIDLVSNYTGAGTGGLVRQFIISDTDLSTFAWSLSGQVNMSFQYAQGFSTPGGNLDERLKFDIKALNILIPAPSAMAMLGLGGLIAGRRRRA